MSGTIWNQYQIDVLNTYACNVAVDENEDQEPSIEKCTHTKKWLANMEINNRCGIKYLRKIRVFGQVVHTPEV